jgi:hypothetical protein
LPHHIDYDNDNDNDNDDPCAAFGVDNEPMTSQVFRTLLFVANGLVFGLAVMLGYLAGSPARHFGESGFTTWVSGAQLLAISVVTWKIWRLRGGRFVRDAWRAPHVVWLLIAAGFLFLTIDELVQIHEQLDRWIHAVLGITETAVTDRLDDVLILGYGLVGLGVLYQYRRELRLFRRDVVLIIVGFVLLSVMIAVDMLFGHPDIIALFAPAHAVRSLSGWAGAVEEGFKLFAEAAFLAAFYGTYRRASAAACRGAAIAISSPS